jgi:hypothetical protein
VQRKAKVLAFRRPAESEARQEPPELTRNRI